MFFATVSVIITGTAVRDSVLLKVDQVGFFELMASNPEIMKQIVKMLTRRIREMNEKLIDAQK